MKRSVMVLLCIAIMAMYSPAFAQAEEVSITLIGVAANGNEFVSVLAVSPDLEDYYGDFQVVWGETGELYRTSAREEILFIDGTSQTMLVESSSSLRLVHYSNWEELVLVDNLYRPSFDGKIWNGKVYAVVSHGDPWQNSLNVWDLSGQKIATVELEDAYTGIYDVDLSGAVMVSELRGGFGATQLVALTGQILDVQEFESVRSRIWERYQEVEGISVQVTGCALDALGECVKGTEYELPAQPYRVREFAYITEYQMVPNTSYVVGWGYSSIGDGFLLVNDQEDWEVATYLSPPTEVLQPFGELPAFAVNNLGEVLNVWGNLSSPPRLYALALVGERMGQTRDLTEELIPSSQELGF